MQQTFGASDVRAGAAKPYCDIYRKRKTTVLSSTYIQAPLQQMSHNRRESIVRLKVNISPDHFTAGSASNIQLAPKNAQQQNERLSRTPTLAPPICQRDATLIRTLRPRHPPPVPAASRPVRTRNQAPPITVPTTIPQDLKRTLLEKHRQWVDACQTGDVRIADPVEAELEALEGRAMEIDKEGFIEWKFGGEGYAE